VTPGLELVSAVNQALANADFRASVRQMHAEGYPLVDMVEALGLDGDMTSRVREIVENLPPETVEGIRRATLEMLDRADREYAMPLDCQVSQIDIDAGVPVDVDVEVEVETQGSVIVIRRSK
jgi:hypothetical protein